jgi:hypothetical protein
MNKRQQLFQDGKCSGRGNKSVFCYSFFVGKNFHLLKFIMSWLTVYGGNVMAVQHVYKCWGEFDSGRLNVRDVQRIAQPSMSADPVQDIDAAVQTDRCVSIAQLKLRFNLSQDIMWDIVHECLGYRKLCSRWVPHNLMHTKDTHGVIPDSSSLLRTAW